MRAAGVALVLVVFGCNQIFGISQTRAWDAHGPIDAPDWKTSITWQTQAAIGGPITFDPIDGLSVQVASFDAGIATDDATITFPLTTLAVDSTGSFLVPYSLGLEQYRIVFTAPDGIPTEIQSNLQNIRFAFPSYGRLDRDTVPAGATFSGTATIATPPPYTRARLLTAGLWSVTEVASTGGSFTFQYQTAAISLSGALGVPHAAAGDIEAVVFMSDGVSADSGYVTYTADGLGSAGPAPWQDPTDTTKMAIYWDEQNIATAQTRITNALGSIAGPLGMNTTAPRWAGVMPSTLMPNFVQSTLTGIPPPVLLPLTTSSATPLQFQNPFAGMPLPTAIYTGDTWTRTVPDPDSGSGSGVPLESGFQSITPADANTPATQAEPDYKVGIARSTSSMPATFGTAQLINEATVVPLGGAANLPLVFGADAQVDDCIVTLYRVETSIMSVTPLARYIVVGTPLDSKVPIVVDAKFLDTSSTFTFGIRCELGRNAAMADFTSVTYPFEMSSTFTATFTVQ
jgi:hypothetical protein